MKKIILLVGLSLFLKSIFAVEFNSPLQTIKGVLRVNHTGRCTLRKSDGHEEDARRDDLNSESARRGRRRSSSAALAERGGRESGWTFDPRR